ncbi:DUF3099 domain-containing protein [Jatrophihabitans fulvus]
MRNEAHGGHPGHRTDDPWLITSAPEVAGDGYDQRRKKYAIMMSIRALCVILAAVTYQLSIILALVFVVGGMVLPWCAVLIANDRPAKKRAPVPNLATGYRTERMLTAGDDRSRTIDG